ncbi:MAG: hypothetical protein WAQ24_04980 [Candidatus Saccharimonadales bacterium]
MSNGEVQPIHHEQFLHEFAQDVGRAQSARLFAMQLELTPHDQGSAVLEAICAVLKARGAGVDARVALDMRYAQAVTRVHNRDFPNWWPLLSPEQKERRRENAAHTAKWIHILTAADALQDSSPRRQSSSHATRARIVASGHIAQHWAVAHQKGGVILHQNPERSSATLSTGNLTTSDTKTMNNMAVTFTGIRGQHMGEVIMRLIEPGAPLRSAGGHVWQKDPNDWVTLFHDYNNVGDPARLPFIHQAAEKLIDPERNEHIFDGALATPKPQTILYTSQYKPDGKLALMLSRAQAGGATVIVPKQPAEDYRVRSFPYSLQSFLPQSNQSNGLSAPERAKASHVKSLVVRYHDNTAALLFGSDNYLTHIQKVVRNEEMAVLLKISPHAPEQVATYNKYLATLLSLGELTPSTIKELEMC